MSLSRPRGNVQPALTGLAREQAADHWFMLASSQFRMISAQNELINEFNFIYDNFLQFATIGFLCELTLKCLLTLECAPFKYVHDLSDLFSRLSLDSRDFIEESLKESLRENAEAPRPPEMTNVHIPLTVREMLKSSKDIYPRLRYGDISGEHHITVGVPNVIVERIMQLSPRLRLQRDEGAQRYEAWLRQRRNGV